MLGVVGNRAKFPLTAWPSRTGVIANVMLVMASVTAAKESASDRTTPVVNPLPFEPSTISSNDPSHGHDSTSCPPAVPPPPPPPLPPPPQAPGHPHASRKKRRVRSFFWKTIPEEKVRGKPNIWTQAVRQQQYQIDVRTVEELFGQQEEVRTQTSSGHPRAGRSRGSFKESKGEVSQTE